MKKQHSWSKVDAQLRKEGWLLLAGSVAAYQCPSPVWGLIFGLAHLFAVAHLHDINAKNWSRNEFIAKLTGDTFLGKEFTEYRILCDQLKEDYTKRDLFIAQLGYWLMIAVIMCQVALLNSFTVSQLVDFFKVLLR